MPKFFAPECDLQQEFITLSGSNAARMLEYGAAFVSGRTTDMRMEGGSPEYECPQRSGSAKHGASRRLIRRKHLFCIAQAHSSQTSFFNERRSP